MTLRFKGEVIEVPKNLWEPVTILLDKAKVADEKELKHHTKMLKLLLLYIFPSMMEIAVGVSLILWTPETKFNVPFLGWMMVCFGALLLISALQRLWE